MGNDIWQGTVIRQALDAGSHVRQDDALADPETMLDVALDESFPASDPPAVTLPRWTDAAPSSGFDEVSEAAIQWRRGVKHNLSQSAPYLAVSAMVVALAAGFAVKRAFGR